NGIIAQLANQLVVSPTAGKCTKLACAIKDFENDSSVIGETADDSDINSGKIGETAHPQALHYVVELCAFAAFLENLEHRSRYFPDSLPGVFAWLALRSIHRLQPF